MTCEIAVMNRHGIALAADSAVTVTYPVNGMEEKRYFKSVNKVFQLSQKNPVGMMVYGSGDMQQVPWEVLAKEYRKKLGDKSFDTLDQYGQDLFQFLKNSTELFPREYQEQLFLESSENAAIRAFLAFTKNNGAYIVADEALKMELINSALDAAINNYAKNGFVADFEQTDLDEALRTFQEPLSAVIRDILQSIQSTYTYDLIVDPVKLAQYGITSIYKEFLGMAYTGVVIAGFGDKDYFPGYQAYNCYGNILGKFGFVKTDDFHVTYYNHSHIAAFATTNMVETFRFGISDQAYSDASIGCQTALQNILRTAGVEETEAIKTAIDEEVKNFRDTLLNECGNKNFKPLAKVVASLPVDDMAMLAETLVSIESLKEKVTQPSESVSGPIDVAVITKGDGLVWIKRKHYFPAELNPKYFQRQ